MFISQHLLLLNFQNLLFPFEQPCVSVCVCMYIYIITSIVRDWKTYSVGSWEIKYNKALDILKLTSDKGKIWNLWEEKKTALVAFQVLKVFLALCMCADITQIIDQQCATPSLIWSNLSVHIFFFFTQKAKHLVFLYYANKFEAITIQIIFSKIFTFTMCENGSPQDIHKVKQVGCFHDHIKVFKVATCCPYILGLKVNK